MEEPEEKTKYIQISASLPDYVYEKLQRIMRLNGLNRSNAIALLIQRSDLDKADHPPSSPQKPTSPD